MSFSTVPSKRYRDYIEDLSSSYPVYGALSNFFESPLVRTKPLNDRETKVLSEGEVTIMDATDDSFRTQRYLISEQRPGDDSRRCITQLDQRPPETQTRIIVISYWRDTATGKFAGLSKEILDAVGLKYRIHPEVYLWHFGLYVDRDKDWHFKVTEISPMPISSRTYFHLRMDYSLITPYLHTTDGATRADTGVPTEKSIPVKRDTCC